MTFKYRFLNPPEIEQKFTEGHFSVNTIEEAITEINNLEIKHNTAVRAYEVISKCRIVGGKLEKVK